MNEEIIKCVKGESCIHCGSTYCRFVDEVDELKQKKDKYYQQTLDDEIQINNLLEEIQQIKQDRNVENITRLSLKNRCLEQENRELKAYKDINEDFKQAWDELNEKYKQLRSALEEIMEILDKDCDYLGNVVNAREFIDKVLTP